MNESGKIHYRSKVVALLITLVCLCSCSERLIFEGEGDCGVYYHIRFKYDYNMKFADAFANEVNSVELYVFDDNNILVDKVKVDDKESLSSGTFEIKLEPKAGDYQLLALGGMSDETSFDLLPETKLGETTLEEMQVRMHREYDYNGNAFVENDLLPLFHGTLPLNVTAEEGTYTETISLTKNTNVIRIMLQEMVDEEIDADKFIFEITDQSGLYAYDNTRLEDETITFKPWSITTGTADIDDPNDGEGKKSSVAVALAEHTIGRMVPEQSPILTIKNRESGEAILTLPIADYALLTKGFYNQEMSDQEFLDRQDEYTLAFFLYGGEWLSSMIYINSWQVIINDEDL